MATDDIVSNFRIDDSDELRKSFSQKVNLGTTILGILRPEAMVICADGRILSDTCADGSTLSEKKVILKENCCKLYSITDSIVGTATGELYSCNKVLDELMKTLEEVKPDSMEEIAGCLAHWANTFKVNNDFLIGGRLSNADQLKMFKISERLVTHDAIEPVLKHSTIAVPEWRGISTGPFVAHAHSVVAIGCGAPYAMSVLECADPVSDEDSLRELANKALEHAARGDPTTSTGGVFRFLTMTQQSSKIRFHSSHPRPNDRMSRYDPPIEGEFKMLKGCIKGYEFM